MLLMLGSAITNAARKVNDSVEIEVPPSATIYASEISKGQGSDDCKTNC